MVSQAYCHAGIIRNFQQIGIIMLNGTAEQGGLGFLG
jgi:hypothetical protein